MKELIEKGYAAQKDGYGYNEYKVLKKEFPDIIYKAKMYGKVMYYMDEKSNQAMQAFLKISNKKSINYS